MRPFFPTYLNLTPGELERRISVAASTLRQCRMCARACAVDRLSSQERQEDPVPCRTGLRARVLAYGPSFCEEVPLVGERGSGAVFFAGLSLKYQLNQSYEIHKDEPGLELEPEQLAAIMLDLQDQGCHNINLISPGHVIPQILSALRIALKAGLSLPLVFNSDGYEAVSTLRLLDGVVDVFVLDMPYSDPVEAARFSGFRDYVIVNRKTGREMHRQVGDLVLTPAGIAKHGLIVRHMVLPRNLAGTEEVARYVADEISPHTFINVMRKYRPSLGKSVPEVDRLVTDEEYAAALEWVKHAGLHRLNGEPEPRGESIIPLTRSYFGTRSRVGIALPPLTG